MVSETENPKKDALAVMKERGKVTDELVLNYIRENPDSTIKKIAEYYDVSNGRVDHSVNRLKEKGFVDVTFFRRNKGLVKKVRAIDSEIIPFGEVSFPLVGLDKNKWKDEVFVCALSRSVIKVSPIMNNNWKNECILIQKSVLSRDEHTVNFKLPEKFVDFYEIPNSEIDISGFADEILLTVDSTVIPVELPYNYEPKAEINYAIGNIRITVDAEYEIFQCNVRPREYPSTSESTVTLSLQDLLKGATITQKLAE